MIFYINGTDIKQYLKYGGIKKKRNDIDGPSAGRNLQGDLIRDRVATKMRWDCTTMPMPLSKANELCALLQPEWLSVRTDFTIDGTTQTYTAYSNNIEVPYLGIIQGVEYADSFTFPIIEK